MESIKELRQKCQAHKINKNFALAKGYTWHRQISIYITKFLLTLFPKIKPNLVSFTMIVVSLTGCLLLLNHSLYIEVFGILLVYLGFLLDKVDGEIARYNNIHYLRGVYLDELYHILIPSALLICFMFFIFTESSILGLLLMLSVLLNLFNRINRKIPLVIFVKKNRELKSGLVENYQGGKIISKFFNFFIFKIFSIIERFDLVIFSILLIIIIEIAFNFPLRIYYLYFYFLFSLGYFIRWSFLNYFGGIDKSVRELDKKGY